MSRHSLASVLTSLSSVLHTRIQRHKNSSQSPAGQVPHREDEPLQKMPLEHNMIRTTDELDAMIDECDRALAISDDAMRAVFATFQMAPPDNLPRDPFSMEYREAQLRLYTQISGRSYSKANEATEFDVDVAVRRPFPFNTQSCATTGEHLMFMGFLLRTMALAPGSRVLEFGPGWGNTTIALAQLGHHITAVDIEPRFCELIKRRAAATGVTIEVVNDDFMWIEQADGQFDAIVFFECFHHASNHLALLRALHRVIKPEGRIFFGAEPITSDFPLPWGLRLDGQSLWSIRKCGWLELGFHEDYFANALTMTGWYGIKHTPGEPKWMSVWEARPLTRTAHYIPASDQRLKTHIGTRKQGIIALDRAAAGTALFGPYITFAPGSYLGRVHFVPGAMKCGQVVFDVCARASADTPTVPLVERQLDLATVTADHIEVALHTTSVLREMEIQLFCEPDCTFQIAAVEFLPTD